MFRLLAVWCIAVCACFHDAFAQDGLHYETPSISSFHALSEDPTPPSILRAEHPMYLTCKATLFEDRQIIDFEKREISFERADKAIGIILWQYRYDELDSYLESRRRFALLNAWYNSQLTSVAAGQEKKKGLNLLQWELPVQYPSWAQRILGKEPPKLSITGYEKIIVAYEYNSTVIPGSNVQTVPTQGLNFDQENQFSITGSIGRLISINIKGSTKEGVDAGNDPLKNFKIEYKGEGDELEDEVLQQVVAGYTGFDMPGTQLSGFSESHDGLFGVKMVGKVGPLTLTGIASQEQGESQTMSFSPTGVGAANTVSSEGDFLKNKRFFLDTMYLSKYLGNKSATPSVAQLQVWIWNTGIANEANAARSDKTQEYAFVGSNRQAYKRLVEKRDYEYHKSEGWIQFDSITIQDADVIGIYLVYDDTVKYKNKGWNYEDTIPKSKGGRFDPGADTLWTLKFGSQDSTYSTFPLMWRNLYTLPSGFDPSKFTLRVTKALPDTSVNKVNGNVRLFSAVLGLTYDNGLPQANTSTIFSTQYGLIILPPFTSTDSLAVRGNEPFANPALGSDNVDRNIYRKTGTDFTQIVPKFQIMMSGSSRKTQFTLGFGSVMEGTEVLKADGTRLTKNTDYLIDYQTGQVDLISKQAINANKIDAQFQSEALFVPKQKVFLGMRGEMKLPFSDKSVLGASVLYQNASTNDQVPKINQEPFSKLLLDMNVKTDWEPEWMTKAVNLLPLVATDAKSSASIELELAHSYTNPNTSNGKDAYIDDFEGSKEVYPPGLSQTSWYQASPPPDSNGNPLNMLYNPPAWIQYWYAPLGSDQPKKSDILFHPQTLQTQTDAEKYEPALKFVCQPAPAATNPFSGRYDNPWAGIMTWFPMGVQNREKDRYLEFWAKNTGGGRLYFDLGLVSEAIPLDGSTPDGKPHYEDINSSGILADSLNIGLDGRVDTAEFYCVPNKDRTGWDTLKYWLWDNGTNAWYINPSTRQRVPDTLLPRPGDPSKDNYRTYGIVEKDQQNNYPYVNGTEKDGNLNTEDINGDGFRTSEAYFRRFIDFDSTADSARNNSFMKRNAGNYMVDDVAANANAANGWHLYRIPLNDTTTGILSRKGSPQWTNIKFLRIWWSNFKKDSISRENSILFARLQFVGNQWLEPQDTTLRNKLSVATVNTVDNYRTYASPPGMKIMRDAQGNLETETSLQLVYNNILPGDAASVKKVMPTQSLNLSSYDNVSILVHGDTARTDFWYFLRFGTDDSTYYECRTRLNQNGAWKEMAVHLHDLSNLKIDWANRHGGSADSIFTGKTLPNGDSIIIHSPKGHSVSFTAVTWMAMGIVRDSFPGGTPYNGQLWVDELKVKGIVALSGYAGRAYLSTHWADFMNLTAGLDYEDGSFRRMTETGTALKNSTLSDNFSLDWKLDKFLPAVWGVNIPLGTRLQEQLTRPQIEPNSDIYLTGASGAPDGFDKMYGELINMIFGTHHNFGQATKSSPYQTTSVSRNWWTGYSKGTMSNNPFENLTLDRIALNDLSYSETESQTGRGLRNDSAIKDLDTTHIYHGVIKYDLSPKLTQKWVKWKPFEGTKLLWLPDRVKGYEFNWLPTTLTFDVVEVNYSKETSIKGLTGDTTRVKKFGLDHRVNLLYDPINILNIGYNLTINRNLDSVAGTMDLQNKWWTMLKDYVAQSDPVWHQYGVSYGERARTQSATLRFDPSFLEWLSHSFDYSANYNQTAATRGNDTTRYQNLKSDAAFHLASTLNLAALFKNMSSGLSGIKALSSTFGSMQKAMEKIAFNSITFDYNAKSSLINNYISTLLLNSHGIGTGKFLEYQLGLYGKTARDIVTGNMHDDRAFGGMRSRGDTLSDFNSQDQRTSDRSYSLSTSFNLPQPIDISFSSITYKWSNSYSVYADTTKIDTTRILPDFGVTGKTGLLNKIPLVNQNISTVQLSSGFNYSVRQHKSGTRADLNDDKSTSYSYNPLFSVDGTLKKWPINISYSHTWTTKEETSKLSKNDITTTDHDNKLTLRYEINKATGGKDEFKFLFWKVPIKGRIETGLEGDYATNVAITKPIDSTDSQGQKTADAMSFSLSPHASYDFTENITGELKYAWTEKKDQMQTVTSHIFSLSVMIRF